ncbi:MAG TPA: hypothetical protein VG456_01960 [Candidatus Sulfopaludibacter sp.]|jgi:hypothetical protein|nr:hypothetical protein [Candidatus Sulfopaludibacter sp.]
MSALISCATKLYRALTYLYPAEFRRRWKEELTDTFALQITDSFREDRWTNAIATCCHAFAELILTGLPLQLTRVALVLPLAAVAGAGAIFYGLVWALQNSLALRALYHHAVGKLGG